VFRPSGTMPKIVHIIFCRLRGGIIFHDIILCSLLDLSGESSLKTDGKSTKR
jgi:hypothetical protein